MDNSRIWPEVVIAGFLHLLWMAILIAYFAGATIRQTLMTISNIQTGAAALLGSVVIGISFFLGLLSNSILVCISEIVVGRASEEELRDAVANTPKLQRALEDRSSHKALYRSSAVSLFFVTICLVRWEWCEVDNGVVLITGITGAILTALALSAFFFQRSFHRQLLVAMGGPPHGEKGQEK